MATKSQRMKCLLNFGIRLYKLLLQKYHPSKCSFFYSAHLSSNAVKPLSMSTSLSDCSYKIVPSEHIVGLRFVS